MQEAVIDWKKRFEDLQKLHIGCETWEHSFIDNEGHREDRGNYLYVTDPTKFDNWGNNEFKFGGYAKDIAWKMATEDFKVQRPYYVSGEDMDKMRFFDTAYRLASRIKERGEMVDEMYVKHGCPKCGNKKLQHLEGDGESEADGCSADWAVWCHWSFFCQAGECDWSIHGQYVTQSGGW